METCGEHVPSEARSTKSILIVGRTNSSNYGSSLQSLALYDAVSARYDCSMLWERRRLTLSAIVRHFTAKRYASKTVVDVLRQVRTDECFADVDKTYLNSRRDEADALKRFSVYLVGGDQLWNPFLVEDTYLLDFAPSTARKASYATSVGVARLPDSAKRRYKKYLSRFDAVSMRDHAGAQAMAEVIGRPVKTVADPVFLTTREGWAEFAKPACDCGVSPGYALMYFVGRHDALGEYNRARAAKLAAERGHRVVKLPMYGADYTDDARVCGVGPREFVRLVSGAEYIYTDSYHMSAFAIIFGKAFSVFKRFEGSGQLNPLARVDELLGTFGAESGADVDMVPRAEWREIIADMRERSLDALYGSIEG